MTKWTGIVTYLPKVKR